MCGVNAGSPAAMTWSTTLGGEKASSALPEAAACAGTTLCRSASACRRPVNRLVRRLQRQDVGTAQDAQSYLVAGRP